MGKLLDGRKIIFYDFEVLSNSIHPETNEPYWAVVFIDKATNRGRVIKNDRKALELFYKQCKNDIFVGYNSRGYDQWIFKGLLLGYCPGKLTKQLIEDGIKGHNLISKHWRIKLLNYDAMSKQQSLKALEAFMGSAIKESDVPFDIDRTITESEEKDLLKYCVHDVKELMRVFDINTEAFNTHVEVMEMFDMKEELISKTSAQLTAIVLEAEKITEHDDQFDFKYPDTLDLNKYTDVYDWFKSIKDSPEAEAIRRGQNTLNGKKIEIKYDVSIAGVPTTYALGGVHGAIPAYHKKGLIYSFDVDSLYPGLILEYLLMSRAVLSDKKFREIRDTRLNYKKLNDPRQSPLKLVINTGYGCFGDKYNALYDPKHMYSICIHGQLLLTDLIEKVEPYCEIFNINTDGVFVLLENEENLKIIQDLALEWSKRTRLGLSWEKYVRVHQKDVNNYIVIPEGKLYDEKGKPRFKAIGKMLKKKNELDNDLPILNKAMIKYFTEGILPEETINNETELIQFQRVVKVTSNYQEGAMYGCTFSKQPVYNEKTGKFQKKEMWDEGSGDKLKDKTFRIFASKRATDGGLYKKKIGANPAKFSDCSERVFIDNDNIRGKEIPEYLDRDWYINEVYNRIRLFLGLDKKTFKKEDLKNYEFTS